MNRHTIAIAIFIIYLPLNMSFSFAESDSQTVSYDQYVAEVIAYYPALKQQSANVEELIAQKAVAASKRMPQAWVSTQYEYGNDPVYVFGALLRQNRFTSGDFALDRLNKPKSLANHSATLGGEWLLFDFSQTIAKVKAADFLAQSSRYTLSATRMEAILAASEVYSRLVYLEQLQELLNHTVEQSQGDIQAAETLSKNGLQLGPAFYSARILQSQLQQKLAEVNGRLKATQMVFNILRGVPVENEARVNLDFDREVLFFGTVADWQRQVLSGRLDLKSLEQQLKAQGIEAEAQGKSYAPQISAFGSVTEQAKDITDEGRDSYLVGVKAKMNLFDPSYPSRVKAAQAKTRELSKQFQELKDQAAKETIEHYYQIQSLQTQKALARRVYEDAKAKFDLTTSLYDHGRANVLQSVESRFGLVEAFERMRQEQSFYRQEILNLKYFAGQLDINEAKDVYGP